MVITAISGNGGHILIRLPQDLPVNDDSKTFIKPFLETVSEEFSTSDVAIDTTVFNPARIWKLYGSKAMKGDEVPGNQYREALVHREAYIDDMGGAYTKPTRHSHILIPPCCRSPRTGIFYIIIYRRENP